MLINVKYLPTKALQWLKEDYKTPHFQKYKGYVLAHMWSVFKEKSFWA
jgi:hypothetical protein